MRVGGQTSAAVQLSLVSFSSSCSQHGNPANEKTLSRKLIKMLPKMVCSFLRLQCNICCGNKLFMEKLIKVFCFSKAKKGSIINVACVRKRGTFREKCFAYSMRAI